MATPDLFRPKRIESYSYQVEGDEYTTYHRAYHMGRRSLADASLEPRDTLPEDSTISIVSSRMGKVKGEASEVAIVVGRKAKYKSGTISCTLTQALQVVTLVSGGPFYPQIVGQLITITGETNVTVTGYTSPTSVTVDVSQTIEGATAATFPFADTELARTRSYRGSKKSYWESTKRFHATPADVEDLTDNLWDSYHLFNTNFPRAYANSMTVIDEDPMLLTKSLITVNYRTAYNPKKYPTGAATLEMYTTGDTKKLQYDLADTPLAIDTKPDAAGYYYAVETGTNIVPDPRVIYVIRTAITHASLDYKALGLLAGKGNSEAFTNIAGEIDAKTMLCMKIACARDYIDDGSDAAVPVQFVFGFYPDGLDNYCTARQRRRWLRAKPVLHPDDDPDATDRYYLELDGGKSDPNDASDAKMRTMMVDTWAKNAAGAETKTRTCIEYDAFSSPNLNTLLNW